MAASASARQQGSGAITSTVRWSILGLFLALGLYQFVVVTVLRSRLVTERQYCKGVCIDVDLASRRRLSPVMYGLELADLNHAIEGGLYPELVRDPSFDALAYLKKPHPPPGTGDRVKQLLSGGHAAVQGAGSGTGSGSFFGAAGNDYYHGGGGNAPPASAAAAFFRGSGGMGGPSQLQLLSMELNASSAAVDLKDGSAWEIIGTTQVSLVSTLELHNAIKIECSASGQLVQLVNKGHTLDGFVLSKGKTYVATVVFRAPKKDIKDMTIALTSADGSQIYDSQTFYDLPNTWTKGARGLAAQADDSTARLELRFMGPGTLELDFVSLMPEDASGGLAAPGLQVAPWDPSLFAALREVQPRFLRFPAGAYGQGLDISSTYRWKAGVGPVEQRSGHPNLLSGYWSTGGFGLYEFLIMAEKLGAEPVLVANMGFTGRETVPPGSLDPWIQDFMDAMEFALGDAESTKYGKLRSEMGRTLPFRLKYVSLGNVACSRAGYQQAFQRFYSAVRSHESWAQVAVLSSCEQTDPSTQVNAWEWRWNGDPDATFQARAVIESRPASAKPFAVTDLGAGQEDVKAAMALAALLSTLENNPDKVRMISAGQMLSSMHERIPIGPRMLVFDKPGTGQYYGTVPYQVFRLYSRYAGIHSLSRYQWYGSAARRSSTLVESSASCLDSECHQIAIKVVNYSPEWQEVLIHLSQASMSRPMALAPMGLLTTLRGKVDDMNTPQSPQAVVPISKKLDVKERINLKVGPWSLSVLLAELDQQ